LKPHALPEYLEGRIPKEKHPFLFQKKFHPRQIRNARSVFLSGLLAYSPVRGAFSERTILVRATTRYARAISLDCFQNKFEFCTIDTAFARHEGELRQFMYYVYILLCKDSKPYVDCSSDLQERIERHKKGQVPATKKRLPINLVNYIAFSDKYKTFNFEKYLKYSSGRAFVKKHF